VGGGTAVGPVTVQRSVTRAALREPAPEVIARAVGSAVTLGGIDVVYVAWRRIAPTCLVDAGAQFGVPHRSP
jgi:hypothetical protein